ncbi:hypothetical protein M197_gp69 [Haloarcula hispanica tailed virus 2]|uniref:Uncharacterized protein n=1 Tax=Haloarcula hispanica tailed virus 2 TaxID=1273751 RepID=R4TM42_9CAUD|nr:hypothetical protein M197_gp69 [Haloarcula hispanica tailed virus 2]AGM11233.1 hypothetical protein HHTV2_68 [Haloarcula hispanica tailed virus 2]
MSEEGYGGAPTYLSECPENTCEQTFIGARPEEVLEHIWEAHGEAKAHYYLDMAGPFEGLPDDYLAEKHEDD